MIGIIFNPKTNKGTSVDRMKHILTVLDEKGVEYIYRESEYAGHSIVLAKELAEQCDILVPSGGDGTVFEVVNGALDADVTFFPLPMGSGNDVCRSLDLQGRTDEELVDILLTKKECDYDYWLLNDKYAMLILLSFGIVTNITYQFSIKKDTVKTGYYSTLLKAILTSKPKRYIVKTDSGEREYFADFVSLQNLNISGGGMNICPDALKDDSVLDLVVVNHKNPLRKFLNMLALNSGKLPSQPNVVTERITFAEITPLSGNEMYCLDGELASTEKAVVRMGKKKLRFIQH